MADNKGVYPLDPNTEVGKFRLTIGDTSSEPFDPPQPGFQNYTMFSDAEIEAFLEVAESLEGAISLAYLQLAGAAALESKSVKDFDLQIDLTKRAGDLRALALLWQDKADALSADIFEVFDTVSPDFCEPELAARRVRCGNQLF